MKIGILTFHRALNYGAFLQAFALKTYLESLGNDVEIVDYWPQGHAKTYNILYKEAFIRKSFFQKMKLFLIFCFRFFRAKKRKQKMEKIQRDFFSLDKTIKYEQAIDLEKIQYDKLVYGSDQIWWKPNYPTYKGFDGAYWGESVPKNVIKISYAASMGIINLSSEDLDIIKKRLKNFEFISVREKNLLQLVNQLGFCKSELVTDPSFLLTSHTWEKLCKPIRATKKYVLLFNLTNSSDAVKLAHQKANELKCKLIEITPTVHPLKFGNKYKQTLDAFEFISYIKNAEFVVTSSFHGVVFSIIFKKQFFSLGMKNNSQRVETLLEMFGIKNRLITDIVNTPKTDIYYQENNPIFEQFIFSSQDFLKRAIQ